jgi:UPF0755 protein
LRRTARRAAVIAGLLSLGALVFPISALFTPAGREEQSQLFAVRPGESLGSVARRLDSAGLLPERPGFGPSVLVALARVSGADRRIKAGEYEFAPTLTPVQILSRLRSGSVRTVPVTLPGGLRLDEVAERLEQAGVTKAEAVVELATDPEYARSLGVEAQSLEGWLYPETYRFARDTPASEVLRTLVREFQQRWTDADQELLAGSGLTQVEVLTIASIVEKETAAPEERPLVAAVFANRLRRGMRLQSDPTVIYGIFRIRGHFDGNLRRRDLEEDTPYNTYTRGGLPPGPIANPTIESIRAVLQPADAPYLYFVSRNDGTHVFSRSLEEHLRAVNRYQRRRPRRDRSSSSTKGSEKPG